MPTIENLRAELTSARRELFCADMIDENRRRDREVEYWQRRVEEIESQLAAAESDPINLSGSGPVPIEPREG